MSYVLRDNMTGTFVGPGASWRPTLLGGLQDARTYKTRGHANNSRSYLHQRFRHPVDLETVRVRLVLDGCIDNPLQSEAPYDD